MNEEDISRILSRVVQRVKEYKFYEKSERSSYDNGITHFLALLSKIPTFADDAEILSDSYIANRPKISSFFDRDILTIHTEFHTALNDRLELIVDDALAELTMPINYSLKEKLKKSSDYNNYCLELLFRSLYKIRSLFVEENFFFENEFDDAIETISTALISRYEIAGKNEYAHYRIMTGKSN